MLEPESDGAGISDGTPLSFYLQDRLPVIVRQRHLGWGGAAVRCCEIGDSLVSSDGLIAWTRCYVQSIGGRCYISECILKRIPYPAVEPVLKLRRLVGYVVGLGIHRNVGLS